MNVQELNDVVVYGPMQQVLTRYNCDGALRGLFDFLSAEYNFVKLSDKVSILMAFKDQGYKLIEILEAYEELTGLRMQNGAGRPDIIMAIGESLKNLHRMARSINTQRSEAVAAEIEELLPLYLG